MTLAITIIIGLAVLAVLVFVHELGHFVTAKAYGVRVEEFGIGFPPRLVSIKRGETRYSLNAVPLGGFVKITGEEDPDVPGSLASRGVGTRLLVFSAGSLVNILLPLFLFSIAFMIPHDLLMGQVIVQEVAPNSPAAMVGIEPGDMFLRINDRPLNNIGDLSRYIQLNLGKEVNLLVEHGDSTTEELQVIPRWKPPEGQGAVGVLAALTNPTIISQHYPFWKAVPMAVNECIEAFVIFKNGLISMIIGTVPAEDMTLVGVVQLTGEVAQTGISPLLEFAALISLILGIGNILPLPALDGGRIAFVLLEWVRRGKRVPHKIEGLIHLVGFVMLMALTGAIVYRDIVRIITGESLIR